MFTSLFANRQSWAALFAILATHVAVLAQKPLTESGQPLRSQPIDGITPRTIHTERLALPYDFIEESDVFWEKRIWRMIDVREKMNHPFMYPSQPFFGILKEAIEKGDLAVYKDEKFEVAMPKEDVMKVLNRPDTAIGYDPATYQEILIPTVVELNWEEIKQYRIKEVWFMDEETSQMKVRILGLCPIWEKKNDNGDVLGTVQLFWVYYPDARPLLARQEAFNEKNDAQRLSWEDVFEARMFSSYIIKESNVHDRYVQNYKPNTADALVEEVGIKNQIFHFEHDLWEY